MDLKYLHTMCVLCAMQRPNKATTVHPITIYNTLLSWRRSPKFIINLSIE